ncbi:hypothetical protein [Laspinema palackyanum]|uniref:hypothetical protein n=1 Tax=Laspinema palackyanum TaxID=3231601 RepID=UPI00345D5EA0|nr:hypothetical protein [Laspinema sp. D2c]
MDLSKKFQETMDVMELGVAELARLSKRSKNNISEIRLGKTNTSIHTFGELLEVAEQARPGFVNRFCQEVSGNVLFSSDSLDQIISELSQEQKSMLLMSLAVNLDAKDATPAKNKRF